STESFGQKNLTRVGLSTLDLSGGNFSSFILSGADLSSATLTNANFTGADIAGASFTRAVIHGNEETAGANFDFSELSLSQLRSTESFGQKNLTRVGLSKLDLSGGNFSSFILSGADLSSATLANADFTDAVIHRNAKTAGADFHSSGFYRLSLSQLQSTASYNLKNLTRVNLRELDLRGGDFRNFELGGADFSGATLTNADFRGAQGGFELDSILGSNIIFADGKISNFDVPSTDETLRIRGHEISAKLVDSQTVSGTIILERGATLDVCAGATMALDGGEIHFETDGSEGSLVSVKKSGNVKISNNARLVVDFTGAFSETLTIPMLAWEAGATVSGLDLMIKGGSLDLLVNAHISLMVNGVTYDESQWDFSTANNALTLTVQASEATKPMTIGATDQKVVLAGADVSATFAATLSGFTGSVSGAGTLRSAGTLSFAGDASAHTGTTSVDGGTFTVAPEAKLGTGAFAVASAGTLRIAGTRDFENAISGAGKLATAGDVTMNGDMSGFKGALVAESGTLSVAEGKKLTLSGTLEAENGATLKLGAGASVSVSATGGVKISPTARLLVEYSGWFSETTSFDALSWANGADVSSLSSLTKGKNLLLLVNGNVYDTDLWDFSTAGNVLKVFGVPAAPEPPQNQTIENGDASVNVGSGMSATFDPTLGEFTGTLSGAGEVYSSDNLVFGGNAGALTGTTHIDGGTFMVSVDATLGTGAFEVAGKLSLNGGRTFGNATSGDGTLEIASGETTFTRDMGTKTLSVKNGATATFGAGVSLTHADATADVAGTLKLAGTRTFVAATRGNGAIELSSGSDVKFTKSVGVKTLNVNAGATLNGGVSLTHGADAVLNLEGTLALNADAGEKVSLGGGKVVLASSANLDLGGTTTRRIAADESALESGARVTIFENGSVEGDARAFLATDPTLSALAASNVVLFDASNGLTVQALTNPEALSGGVNTSGLSASFVDWALGGLADELASLSAGFTNASTLGALGGNDPLLNALLSGESGTARAILDRLSPKSYAAMIAMPVETFHDDVRNVAARLEQRRHDSFYQKSHWEFFAQAQTTSAENDTATDAPTFDFDRSGVFAGADVRLDKTTTLGVALGAGTGKAKIRNGGGKIESDDYRLIVFGGKTLANLFYVNAGAQLGFASYDVKRTTDYGGASASADGWNAGVFAETGARLTLSEANELYATPYVGLAYTHASTDSFTESGNERAAFDADSLSGDSLRARIGCAFSWSFDVAGTEARLGLDVAYSRELLDDEIDVNVTAKNGTRISEKAKTAPTDMFSIGPTLDVALTNRMNVYAGYMFRTGTDSSTTHSANVGFRMRF
ncbi:MAG: autotransporter domain-containing protein, partial [Candidatus Spyradosoma sp.]